MTKEEFMLLTEEAAVEYIKNTYCTDDINDVCEKFIEDFSEDLNEDELESFEIDEEGYTPFELVIEILEGNNLKEFLWEDIVEECEEIDTEEVGFDCIAFEPDKAQECLSEQLTEVERSGLAWKQFVQNIQRIVLFVITLLLVYGSVYNVRALLTHSGTAWQNIMWSFTCIFLTIICSLTLYSDFKNK